MTSYLTRYITQQAAQKQQPGRYEQTGGDIPLQRRPCGSRVLSLLWYTIPVFKDDDKLRSHY